MKQLSSSVFIFFKNYTPVLHESGGTLQHKLESNVCLLPYDNMYVNQVNIVRAYYMIVTQERMHYLF